MCRKISASVNGGRAEGLACADPGARTPIGASRNYYTYRGVLEIIAHSFSGPPLPVISCQISQAPLTMDMVEPDVELKERVKQWIEGKKNSK